MQVEKASYWDMAEWCGVTCLPAQFGGLPSFLVSRDVSCKVDTMSFSKHPTFWKSVRRKFVSDIFSKKIFFEKISEFSSKKNAKWKIFWKIIKNWKFSKIWKFEKIQYFLTIFRKFQKIIKNIRKKITKVNLKNIHQTDFQNFGCFEKLMMSTLQKTLREAKKDEPRHREGLF